MLHSIVYCKSDRRRPVRLCHPRFPGDLQGDIPPAWCIVCGSEVFDSRQRQCIRCRLQKGEAYE